MGYDTTDNNGEAIEQWADSCDLTLIHDAKLPKSFNSARWKKGYKPGLIFASGSITNMCKKSIMDPILHTQLTTAVKRGRRLESCLMTLRHPILHV